jgi:hypothetical protein
MRHEKEPISEKLKTISLSVALLLTLGSVVNSIFTFASTHQLQPYDTRIFNLEKAQAVLEENQKTLATKEQVDSLRVMINGRLTPIENRIEVIYQRLMK